MKFLIHLIMLICFLSSTFASQGNFEINPDRTKNKIQSKLIEAEHLYKQGINYRDGKITGFPKNSQVAYEKAKEYFKAAIDKLNPSIAEEKDLWVRACHNYACRLVDLGDYQEAYDWFEETSNKGLKASQENLKKLRESYAWHLVPLGDDLIIKLATYLPPKSFFHLMQISKHLYSLCNSDYLILPSTAQELKETLINCPSSNNLAFKAKRTKNGFNKLAKSLTQMASRKEDLRALGKAPKAFDKLFLLAHLLNRATMQLLLANAEEVWKIEAEGGDKNAMINYARLLGGQKRNPEMVVYYLNKAFENSPLGVRKAQDQFGEEIMRNALQGLEKAPLPKQLEMYYQLAERSYTLQEYEKAKDYFEQVIKRSVEPTLFKTKASYYLSGMYYSGLGCKKDHPCARVLFEGLSVDTLLPMKERIRAHFNLAEMLYLVEGGPQDYSKARQLYTIVMNSNSDLPNIMSMARFRLAGMKSKGEGGSIDHIDAERLFKLVITDPHTLKDDLALANFNLAEMYYFGFTIQEDQFVQARALYSSLTRNVDLPEEKRALCQYRLADMLFIGKGGNKDMSTALNLYKSLLNNKKLNDDDAYEIQQRIKIIQSILKKE